MPHPTQSMTLPEPWWRHGLVWLVLSGPIVVVLASSVTFWLAAHGADVLADDARPRGPVQRQAVHERALLPAQQARNHAATPAAEAP
jgi:uncharacterized protein